MSKAEKVIEDIFEELRRAEELHPGFPDDIFIQLAIIGEEYGEAQDAALDHAYHGGKWVNIRKELIHTAATTLRTLLAIKEQR